MENNKYTEDFVSTIKGTAIVKFGAEWCGPCKMIEPVLNEIDAENEDLQVYQIDTDQNQDLAIKHNIRSIPTIMIVKDGKVITEFVGVKPKQEIIDLTK
jgi:thioredoxin 1